MNQPMKRKPGRPRKHPLPSDRMPDAHLYENRAATHADDARGEERPATGAEGVGEGTGGLLGGVQEHDARATFAPPSTEDAGERVEADVDNNSLLLGLNHDQDEEHVVADEAERADSGAGEDREDLLVAAGRPDEFRADAVDHNRSVGAIAETSPRNVDEQARQTIQGHELAAMKEEAWQAFDYREGCGKTDTLGRIWEFAPETRQGLTVVTFSMRRPCGPRQERTISTAQYGTDTAREQSDALVEEMNGWAL